MENVEELNVPNMGAIPVDRQDFFKIDGLEFVKSLNLDLGSTSDPNHAHFEEFTRELQAANVELIELNKISEEPIMENIDVSGAYNTQYGPVSYLNNILQVVEGALTLMKGRECNLYTSQFDERGYMVNSTEDIGYSIADVFRSEQILNSRRDLENAR